MPSVLGAAGCSISNLEGSRLRRRSNVTNVSDFLSDRTPVFPYGSTPLLLTILLGPVIQVSS